MKKQKIKIINGTIVAGIGDARPGTQITVDPGVARQLFIAGKAVPVEIKPARPAVRKPSAKKVQKK